MKSLIFTILFMLAFSISGQTPKNGPYIDPFLDRAVNDWVLDMKKSKLNWKGSFHRFDSIVSINFPTPGILGYCDKETKVIYISKTVIDNPFLVKMVVYHELGHCILEYDHICDRMAIMNPALNFYPRELYQSMWDRLVEDFFDKNRGIQCPELRITENQVEPELVLPNIQICPH